MARILLGLLLLITPASAAAEEPFEEPPVLRASELLPPSLRSGDGFRVDEEVPTEGFLARFTLRTEFGDLEVRGPDLLAARIHEVAAIRELDELENSDEFQQGLRDSVGETREALAAAAADPVETAKAIPGGLKRFVDRTMRAGKTAVQTLEERRAESQAEGTSDPDLAEDVTRSAGRAAADLFGYDDARRELARRLAVDPYTTNPILSKRLDEVAQAGFAGRVGVSLAKTLVPGSALLSATETVSDWVWDTPPGEVDVRIEKILRSLAVPQDEIDRLLRHEHYTVTLRGALVESIRALDGVAGVTGLIPWALSAASEDEARIVVRSGLMLVAHDRDVEPLTGLLSAEPAVARTAAGSLAAILPLDYVAWTETARDFAERPDLAASERTLWLTGRVSPRTERELEARGWTLRQNALNPTRE